MVYTLEDIRNFLKQKNVIDWNYEVWDSRTGQKRSARFEDFNYSARHFSTDLVFCDKLGTDFNLKIYATDFKFITYAVESNIMDSGSTISIDKNYTNDWIEFLFHKHKKEYAKFLLNFALNNKQIIKEKINEKNEKYRLETQINAKAHYKYYKDLEQKAKSILNTEDILKIEQQNSLDHVASSNEEKNFLDN